MHRDTLMILAAGRRQRLQSSGHPKLDLTARSRVKVPISRSHGQGALALTLLHHGVRVRGSFRSTFVAQWISPVRTW
jgi:hypothetical protein